MKYKFTKETLEEAVADSLSIADVCRKLQIRPVGGNYKTLKTKFKEMNIDISHFTGSAWNRGINFKPFGKKRNLQDILVQNSPHKNSNSLKQRLIKEKIFEEKCNKCGLIDWNSKPIPLELDHINGINTDNRLENLRILCPNCHAQTSSYRGKSKLSALSEKRDVEYRKFRESLTANPEPSLIIKEGAETKKKKEL